VHVGRTSRVVSSQRLIPRATPRRSFGMTSTPADELDLNEARLSSIWVLIDFTFPRRSILVDQ
jgi:hypothetical protein